MADLNPQNSFMDRLFCSGRPMMRRRSFSRSGITIPRKSRRPSIGRRFSATYCTIRFSIPGARTNSRTTCRWNRKAYFSALGVVSSWLRDQCTAVLDQVLEREKSAPLKCDRQSGKYKAPRSAIDKPDAEAKAEDTIMEDLLKTFNLRAHQPQKQDRSCCGRRSQALAPPDDPYLEALPRMMHIETKCFGIQRDFLEKGNAPT